jgi:hypothetical protein
MSQTSVLRNLLKSVHNSFPLGLHIFMEHLNTGTQETMLHKHRKQQTLLSGFELSGC